MTKMAQRFIHRVLGKLVLVTGFLLLIPNVVSAIGISPALTFLENIPQNAEIERVIFISRGNPAQTERAKVTINGPVASYVVVPTGGIVTMPQGLNNTPVPLVIKTGTLPAGTYDATIDIVPVVEELAPGQGTGSRILAGVQGRLRFSVTTKALEKYTIRSGEFTAVEQGQSIGLSYQLVNEGNTDARPSAVAITLVDEKDPTRQYTGRVEGTSLDFVGAFSERTVTVPTELKPGVGVYRGTMTFYRADAPIFTKNNILVQVFPAGTLAQRGEITSINTDKEEYAQGESVKVVVTFANTGESAITGAAVVEIFQDTARLEVLKSEPTLIYSGKTNAFDLFYKPERGGRYHAEAAVVYGPHKTQSARAEFMVKQTSLLFVFLALGAVTVLVALVLLWRRKRARSSIQTLLPPST